MEVYRHSNRFKAHRTPKMGKFWCPSCDRAYIGSGEKCPICKKRSIRRDKK